MKIVLCCRVYSVHNRVGGMIHVVVERAEELVRQGHDVHVLTTSWLGNNKVPYDYRVNGVRIYAPFDGEPQQYSDQYADMCFRLCTSIKPDIIHLDSWDKHRIWWAPFRSRCRVAVTNHGEAIGSQLTDWRLRLHGRSVATPGGESEEVRCSKCSGDIRTCEWLEERDQLLKADVVIATCRFDRWLLSDLLGLKHVSLVRNPLAPYHFQGRALPLSQENGARKQFLSVGVWGHGERGFDVAREACVRAGAFLEVPRGISRRDLVRWYDGSQALLLPGFQSKGWDLSIAESIARLRPVIVSDNGPATMEAIDKSWIVTVPAGDVDALAEALQRSMPLVSPDAASEHRPSVHVDKWLKAVTG